MSKRKTREKRQLLTATGLSLAVFLLPPIATAILIPPLKKPNPNSEILRIQPGQTILPSTQNPNNPETEAILAVETLNSKITEIILKNPKMALILPSKTPAEMESLLQKEIPEEELEKALKAGAVWNPSAHPWGIFLLPGEKPPDCGLPFGVISPPGNQEFSRELVETTLNQILFLTGKPPPQNQDPILNTLQEAVEKNLLTAQTARTTLALAQIQNIQFHPQKNLFLSKKTLETLEEILKNIGTLPDT